MFISRFRSTRVRAALVITSALAAAPLLAASRQESTSVSRTFVVELSSAQFVPTAVLTVANLNSGCADDDLLRWGGNEVALKPGMYQLSVRAPRDGLELPWNLTAEAVIVEVPEDPAKPVATVRFELKRTRGIVVVVRPSDPPETLGGSLTLVRVPAGSEELPAGWRAEAADWTWFSWDAPAAVLACPDPGPWRIVLREGSSDRWILGPICSIESPSLKYVVIDV